MLVKYKESNIFRAIAIAIIYLFVYNDIAFALAPELALTKPEFEDNYLANSVLLTSSKVNDYIILNINRKLRDIHKGVPVYGVPGLLKNRGQISQIYFEGIDVEGKDAVPVFAVDSNYFHNETVRNFEIAKIAGLEEIRRQKGFTCKEMAEWIKRHVRTPDPGLGGRTSRQILDEIHERAHSKCPGIDRLYERIKAKYIKAKNRWLKDEDKRQKDRAESLLNFAEMYAVFRDAGNRLDKDGDDINIAAHESAGPAAPGRSAIIKAMLDDDYRTLLNELRRQLKSASSDPEELINFLKICDEAASTQPDYPIESRYPILRAVALLDKSEEEELKAILKQEDQYRATPVIDSILWVIDEEIPSNWVEQHAPNLKGRVIRQAASEIWNPAGGLGRVMQFEGIAMHRIISAQKGALTSYESIEPFYDLGKNADGSYVSADYAAILGVKPDDIKLEYRFDVIACRQYHEAFVLSATNEYGIKVYLIGGRRKSDNSGNNYFTHGLYLYRNPMDPSLVTREEFSAFFSAACVELEKKLEEKRCATDPMNWKAPVSHYNDGQLGMAPYLRKMYYANTLLNDGLAAFTSHTYFNRCTFEPQDLYQMGVPYDDYKYFMEQAGRYADSTSAGARTCDWYGGVAAEHVDRIRGFCHDHWGQWQNLKMIAVTNGDIREITAHFYRETMRRILQGEPPAEGVDLDRPTPEIALKTKAAAKQEFGLDPAQPVLSYTGRCVPEKAGRERALTDKNIRELVEMGVQVVIGANCSSDPGIVGSFQGLADQIKSDKTADPEKYPGSFIFIKNIPIEKQRQILAASDAQVQDSDPHTEAAGYSESDISACGGIEIAPPWKEGLLQKQGVRLNFDVPGEGNTVIPDITLTDDELRRIHDPQVAARVERAYLDFFRKTFKMGRDARETLAKLSHYEAASVRLSRVLTEYNTAAEHMRQWSAAIAKKDAAAKPAGQPTLRSTGKGPAREFNTRAGMGDGDTEASGFNPLVLKCLQQLRDGNYQERMKAISALGEIGNSQAVPALTNELDAEDWETRQRAFIALEKICGTLTDEIKVRKYIMEIQDVNPEIRRVGLTGLSHVDVPSTANVRNALPNLAKILGNFNEGEDITRLAIKVTGLIARHYAEAITVLEESVLKHNGKLRPPDFYGNVFFYNDVFVELTEIGNKAIPALRSLLLNADYHKVRAAAAKALGKLKVKEAIPDLLRALAGNIRSEVEFDVKLASVEALAMFGPLAREAIPRIIPMFSSAYDAYDLGAPAVYDILVRSLKQICVGAAIDEELFKKIVSMPACRMSVLLIIQESNPQLFIGEAGKLGRLLKLIKGELDRYPPEGREGLLKQFDESIGKYFRYNVYDVHPHLYEYISPVIYPECDRIASLMNIVHDNLPLCLDSLKALPLRIQDVEELINVIPLNNPLTRIIRMLGERESSVIGFHSLVSGLLTEKKFDHLYKLIVAIAGEKQRAAPAQIAGILYILMAYAKQVGLLKWRDKEWEAFSSDIREYYDSGLKVVTLRFFAYFKKHKKDASLIQSLRSDIEKELSQIGWGNFFGLRPEFKRKYGVTDLEEMALLARYIQINNFTSKDYERTYIDLRSALKSISPEAWQAQIPDSLRTLYTLKGTRTNVVYQAREGAGRAELEKLGRGLSSYTADSGAQITLKELLDGLTGDPSPVKAWLAARLLSGQSEEGQKYFKNMPETPREEREWLSRWHGLLADTLMVDSAASVKEKMGELAEGACYDMGVLEEDLSKLGLKWIDISSGGKFPQPDNAFIRAAGEGDTVKIKDFVKDRWLVLMEYGQLKDRKKFENWIESGFGKFIKHIERNFGAELSADTKTDIRDAIFQARNDYLADENRTILIREGHLAKILLERTIGLFSEDIDFLSRQLGNFKDINIPSDEDLYVGFFDDLLHLAGEFMMTGVCTWDERASQVLSGKKEGYHFGTIAVKNPSGGILGFSQVQLIKTPLKGVKDKDNRGFRVLSLTGINLSEKELPIDRKRAVLVILKAAYELAKSAGLQGAVLVVREDIHSNQQPVKAVIKELVHQGLLREATLASEINLCRPSPNHEGYSYDKVYIIQDIPGLELKPAARESIIANQKEEDVLLEKKHISFYSGLGSLVYGSELSDEQAGFLTAEIARALKKMPEGIADNLKLNLDLQGIAFKVVFEPALGKSRVSRSEGEITLYLGKDVISNVNAIKFVDIRTVMAEAVTAAILPDYNRLKEESSTNENAYFKLELIKELLNYRTHTPDASYALRLISQRNVFLNVMDDGLVQFLRLRYLNIVSSKESFNDAKACGHIMTIANLDIFTRISIAHLRNVFKEFFYNGKVYLRIGDRPVKKEAFDNFDSTKFLSELKDTLLTAPDADTFYRNLRRLIGYALPLNKEQLDREMTRVFDKDVFSKASREDAIRDVLREILIRRVGTKAFEALRKHLCASRGSENIPYIELSTAELNDGDDADNYSAMYEFHDWTTELFAGAGDEYNPNDDLLGGQDPEQRRRLLAPGQEGAEIDAELEMIIKDGGFIKIFKAAGKKDPKALKQQVSAFFRKNDILAGQYYTALKFEDGILLAFHNKGKVRRIIRYAPNSHVDYLSGPRLNPKERHSANILDNGFKFEIFRDRSEVLEGYINDVKMYYMDPVLRPIADHIWSGEYYNLREAIEHLKGLIREFKGSKDASGKRMGEYALKLLHTLMYHKNKSIRVEANRALHDIYTERPSNFPPTKSYRTVLQGESQVIEVSRRKGESAARIQWAINGKMQDPIPMKKSADGRKFSATIPVGAGTIHYAVEVKIGGTWRYKIGGPQEDKVSGVIKTQKDMRGKHILEVRTAIFDLPKGQDGRPVWNKDGSLKISNFDQLRKLLPELKKHYDAIWLMDCFEWGPVRSPGKDPSSFAPLDHVTIAASLGGEEALNRLKEEADGGDKKIDLVLNLIPHISQSNTTLPAYFPVCRYNGPWLVRRDSSDGQGDWDDSFQPNWRRKEVMDWYVELVTRLAGKGYSFRADVAHAFDTTFEVDRSARGLAQIFGDIVTNDRRDNGEGFFKTTDLAGTGEPNVMLSKLAYEIQANAPNNIIYGENFATKTEESGWVANDERLIKSGVVPYNSLHEELAHVLRDSRDVSGIIDHMVYRKWVHDQFGGQDVTVYASHDYQRDPQIPDEIYRDRPPLQLYGDGIIPFLATIFLLDYHGPILWHFARLLGDEKDDFDKRHNLSLAEFWKIWVNNIRGFDYDGAVNASLAYLKDNPNLGKLGDYVFALKNILENYDAMRSPDTDLARHSPDCMSVLKNKGSEFILGFINYGYHNKDVCRQFPGSAGIRDDQMYELEELFRYSKDAGLAKSPPAYLSGNELRNLGLHEKLSAWETVIYSIKPVKLESYTLNVLRRSMAGYKSFGVEDRVKYSLVSLALRDCLAKRDFNGFKDILVKLIRIARHTRTLEIGDVATVLYDISRHYPQYKGIINDDLAGIALEEGAGQDMDIRYDAVRILRGMQIGEVAIVSLETRDIAGLGGLALYVRDIALTLVDLGLDTTVFTNIFNYNREGNRIFESIVHSAGLEYADRSVVVPFYGEDPGTINSFNRAYIYETMLGGKVRTYALHNDRYGDVLYGGITAEDLIRRYRFFSLGALETIRAVNVHPAALQTNEGATGLAIPYLTLPEYGYLANDPHFSNLRVKVHGDHNLDHNYQNIVTGDNEGHKRHLMRIAGLNADNYGDHMLVSADARSLEINPTYAANNRSDFSVTVSPGYRDYTAQNSAGIGLGDLMRSKRDSKRYAGEQNGIDNVNWQKRILRQQTFFECKDANARRQLFRRAKNNIKPAAKNELQEMLDLNKDSNACLFTMLHRLCEQKGYDIAIDAIKKFLNKNPDAQVVIGGPAEDSDKGRWFEGELKKMQDDARYKGRFKYVGSVSPNSRLYELIYLGADSFLMPSKLEPGGLSQLEAFAAGTVVVARDIDGLSTSVIDVDESNEKGVPANGFKFFDFTPAEFKKAMERALAAFRGRHDIPAGKEMSGWDKLSYNAFTYDSRWIRPAKRYINGIYANNTGVNMERAADIPELLLIFSEAEKYRDEWSKPESMDSLERRLIEHGYNTGRGLDHVLEDAVLMLREIIGDKEESRALVKRLAKKYYHKYKGAAGADAESRKMPNGSILRVFEELCKKGITDSERALSGREIAKLMDRSYETVKYDLRALYYHLRLLRKPPGEKKIKREDARYFVPPEAKKNAQLLYPELAKFRGKHLRPSRFYARKFFTERIDYILQTGKPIFKDAEVHASTARDRRKGMVKMSSVIPEIKGLMTTLRVKATMENLEGVLCILAEHSLSKHRAAGVIIYPSVKKPARIRLIDSDDKVLPKFKLTLARDAYLKLKKNIEKRLSGRHEYIDYIRELNLKIYIRITKKGLIILKDARRLDQETVERLSAAGAVTQARGRTGPRAGARPRMDMPQDAPDTDDPDGQEGKEVDHMPLQPVGAQVDRAKRNVPINLIKVGNGSTAKLLRAIKEDPLFAKAMDKDKGMALEMLATAKVIKKVSETGIFVPVSPGSSNYCFSDMMRGKDDDDTKTFINALQDVDWTLPMADLAQAVRMTIISEMEKEFAVPAGKTIYHIIEQGVVPLGQRSTLVQAVNNKFYRDNNGPERIMVLNDRQKLADVISDIRAKDANALISVALNDESHIEEVRNDSIKKMVFKTEDEFIDLNGVLKALRALYSEDPLPILTQLYTVMAGIMPPNGRIPAVSGVYVFNLPRISRENIDDIPELNKGLLGALTAA